MTPPDKVFVYGTLKPGGRYWPRFCEGKVVDVVPAKVRGELYDLHVGYPGLRLQGEAWVQGCVLSFPEAADFREVDRLEGYDPSRSPGANEYNRVKVPCFDAAGASLGMVWAYEMSEAMIRRFGGTRIDDGNWPV